MSGKLEAIMWVSNTSSFLKSSVPCSIVFAFILTLGLVNGPASGTALGQAAAAAPATPAPSYGKPIAIPPGMDPSKAAAMKAAAIKAAQAAAKNGKPGDKADKGKPEEKKDEKKDKADEDGKEVKRPTEPPKPPDPEELKVQPDKDNKVKVNFKGQPWPAVLEWLADISDMSFDWQESPSGFLNLTTNRSYKVEEIRDLINRLLLDRGYTLLGHDEVMSLVNIKKLNPSMIPRVSPQDLAGMQPHEFVKVSFALNRLVAEATVEELKPMLSPNGKLTAMRATNRIEAIDAVVNLREIHGLLDREQSNDERQLPPRLFELKYRRASEVVPQLQTLLGLESKKPAGPMTPQQMQAQQQAMMRAQQQAAKGKQPPTPKPAVEIHLLADDRNNYILVQAPPDKMAIIARAITVIDVPLARDNTLQATLGRMQIYHLSTMNPEPLVKTLKEIGNLELDTRLEVDKDNKAIIAYGSLADHVTIRSLIEKLDGSGREFHVIRLRRLEADYVAGTIQHMIFGGEEEPKKDNNSSRYFGFYGRSSSGSQAKQKKDRFRVDADVEQNRLLLWANDIEMEDVREFLVKLGEIPPEGGNPDTIRVLDTYDKDEAAALIERLRQVWPGKNRLQIETTPTKTQDPKDKQPDVKNTPTKSARHESPAKIFLAKLHQDSPSTNPQAEKSPPITITRNANGQLVIASEDTAALDILEQLIVELTPPQKDYHIFRLKHAWAYDVVFILESFFKEEGEDKEKRRVPYWWYDYGSTEKTKERARLSKRRPLRFILDSESNSILVQGADAEKVKQIQELVDFYDKIDQVDPQIVRQTATFTIRHSKASVIAEAIKEVYRDLLSSSDKAFSGEKKNERTRIYFDYAPSEDGNQVTKAPKFKGLLSIGVDDVSNTLIVSAPTYLFTKVSEMIQTLDRAAWPVANVRLVRVGENVNPEHLKKLLMAVTDGTFKKEKPAEKEDTSQMPLK